MAILKNKNSKSNKAKVIKEPELKQTLENEDIKTSTDIIKQEIQEQETRTSNKKHKLQSLQDFLY